jgi:predicted nucleic-acid-binding Zn-ribbon protein
MKVKVRDLCPECRNTNYHDGVTIGELITRAEAGTAARGMPDVMLNLAVYYGISCEECKRRIKYNPDYEMPSNLE